MQDLEESHDFKRVAFRQCELDGADYEKPTGFLLNFREELSHPAFIKFEPKMHLTCPFKNSGNSLQMGIKDLIIIVRSFQGTGAKLEIINEYFQKSVQIFHLVLALVQFLLKLIQLSIQNPINLNNPDYRVITLPIQKLAKHCQN